MQLGSGSVRARLAGAACMLLAAGIPAVARAEAPGVWQFEGSALIYGEENRTNCGEPVARVTRLFPDGQTLSAQLTLDVMTGASPTGAGPPGKIQTMTTASGNVVTLPADRIPTSMFKDVRGALDLEWTKPVGSLLTATSGTHYSRERDYQSMGVNETVSLDLMHRLTTLTVGGGYNRDDVIPIGGFAVGMTDSLLAGGSTSAPKRVATGMLGLSRILTRRWMVGATWTRTVEDGYLTEPYKLLSVIDPTTGINSGTLHENRPGRRTRNSVLGSSVYAMANDVLYLDYRWYKDDWGIRSDTYDLRYRHELPDQRYIQPHVRFYTQTAADFYRYNLLDGDSLPQFATSDFRLGPLRTATVGATFGFTVPNFPGELSVRAEYIRQWGKGRPGNEPGVQSGYDLFPGVNIGTLLAGWTVNF
jgi:hypothetical protein